MRKVGDVEQLAFDREEEEVVDDALEGDEVLPECLEVPALDVGLEQVFVGAVDVATDRVSVCHVGERKGRGGEEFRNGASRSGLFIPPNCLPV